MILSGRWVVPISAPAFENGAVVIQGDRIIDVGSVEEIRKGYPNQPWKNFPTSVLLPGLVNVHSHLELTILRGYLEGLDFWRWIRRLTQTKYQVLSRDDLLNSALLGAVEAIRAGITTLADPMDIGTSLEAILMAGLRGILYQEVFSPDPAESDVALESLRSKLGNLEGQLAHWPDRRSRVSTGVSPHAPYTVSGRLFQKVHEFARSQDLPVCIHLAESDAETALLRDGSGPIADSYRERGIAWKAPECTPVEYLERLGVLGRSMLLVHCVRLTASDFAVLQERGVSVAHCPKSNVRLGHGFMNLREMLRRGIPLGLGSDSVASNNAMDLFEEMRFALANPSFFGNTEASPNASEQLSAAAVLRLATLGGAEALGLAAEIGSLEPGKQADLIAVDLARPHVLPVFSPIDALVHAAKASDVHLTMVAGEILYEAREVGTISEPALCRSVEKIREKLLHAPGQN